MPTELVFTTLFLGLTQGPQPVALAVVGEVAAIELRLDGRAVERLAAPPWQGTVDFGLELVPHELEAVAFGASGEERARVRQWVNLPRQPAEVEILLEPAGARPTAARLAWQSLTGPPREATLTLDGRELALGADLRAALPAVDLETSHVLAAELRFADGVSARQERAFGGRFADSVDTQLTAVPVVLPGRGRAPRAAELAGWLLADGRPLAVVAVEQGPAQLVLVRDLDAEEALRSLGSVGRRVRDGLAGGPSRLGALPSQLDPEYYRYTLRLPAGDVVRFLWPTAKLVRGSGLPAELFDTSRGFGAAEGGLHWLLTRVRHPGERPTGQRFADATAVAGLQALAGNRRRAVLLVLGDAVDASRLSPAVARGYLEAVRVPLVVWALGDAPAPGWGESETIASRSSLSSAFGRLERTLAGQRIVWVEGELAPHRIHLSSAARAAGLRLAGEPRSPG
jgi:hypothetical protein